MSTDDPACPDALPAEDIETVADPEAYETGWYSTGSRTIDPGMRFVVSASEYEVRVTRVCGPWTVEDLFHGMRYWPKGRIWQGSSRRLGNLLRHVATAAEADLERVRMAVLAAFGDDDDGESQADNREVPLTLREYLALEASATTDEELAEVASRASSLHGQHQVPGIPSPECWSEYWADLAPPWAELLALDPSGHLSPQDILYNALDLEFDAKGWRAVLRGDRGMDDLFAEEIFDAEIFADVFDATAIALVPVEPSGWAGYDQGYDLRTVLPVEAEELAKDLIHSDPRWRRVVTGPDPAPSTEPTARFVVDVCDTPGRMWLGMQFRLSYPPYAVMVFPDVTPSENCLHMRNCLFRMDVAGLDASCRVVALARLEPEVGRFPVPAGAVHVVEAVEGFFSRHGIREGDVLSEVALALEQLAARE